MYVVNEKEANRIKLKEKKCIFMQSEWNLRETAEKKKIKIEN